MEEFYSYDSIEQNLEEGEISSAESGFMRGYLAAI